MVELSYTMCTSSLQMRDYSETANLIESFPWRMAKSHQGKCLMVHVPRLTEAWSWERSHLDLQAAANVGSWHLGMH